MNSKVIFSIREFESGDQSFLYDMLYQSIFVEPGSRNPDRNIIKDPEISKYVENWGGTGDYCLIAIDDTQNRIGAVWLRYFDFIHKGYGYIDDEIPEIGIAVDESSRGRGVGSALIEKLLDNTRNSIASISLSVQPDNPAAELYRRFNFIECGTSGDAVIMRYNSKSSGVENEGWTIN